MSVIREKAFEFIDSKQNEMLALWKKLVNMESGSRHKDDVDKVAVFLKETADSFGARARILEFAEAGNGLIAEFGNPADEPHVCFLGHIDTVFPRGTVEQRPFKIESGKAYGPGVLDMKGGVVIQLYVARALMNAGYSRRQIRVILAGDEETGHHKSNMAEVFEKQCAGACATFNFEIGEIGGELVVGRKGTVSYDIATEGVTVHAGREPQNGRNAILEMAHKVIAIQALTDYEKGITFNVGTIKGGSVRNAVPGHAEIEVDVRVMEPNQYEYVDQKISEIVKKTYVEGTTTTFTKKTGIPPMVRTAGNDKLFELVSRVSAELGFQAPTAIISGGGTDSAYSVKAGVPTIDQLGVKGEGAHSDREYAVVDTLFERARLAIACILELN